jgi:quercetin dioxygenase-like cupin family protein
MLMAGMIGLGLAAVKACHDTALTNRGRACIRERRGGAMAIIRIYTGSDGTSHFEEIQPQFKPLGDQSESAELIPGSGIVVRRFSPTRTNPWHHAPAHAAVFTLSGAVDIEIGDGTVRRLGPGDILIAEDLTGQGHVTREVGPEPRVSIFVPLP